MDIPDWLFEDIVIRRSFYNTYYVAIAVIMALALYIAVHYRFKRLSFFLWVTSGIIGFGWELSLFALGLRHYNPGFIPQLELFYHALTEAGPGLIIMIIAAHQWGIVDLTEYGDDAVTGRTAARGGRTAAGRTHTGDAVDDGGGDGGDGDDDGGDGCGGDDGGGDGDGGEADADTDKRPKGGADRGESDGGDDG